MREHHPPDTPLPLAYLITFACYGARLHGDQAGSVDRLHNLAGSDFLPPDANRESTEKRHMKQSPYELDKTSRAIVLNSIVESRSHKGWNVLAVHVRRNHVHVVVMAHGTPERMLSHFKAYCSRALNRNGREMTMRIRWARHGSTRYLWKLEHVRAALEYVVHGQGEPMAVWENARDVG
jgi:REP element-mobilizing transposase RayT